MTLFKTPTAASATPGTLIAPDPAAREALLASLDVDLAPPVEQAWLWAAPETRPLRLATAWDPASPGLESVLNDAGYDILGVPNEDPAEASAPRRWRARMEQAVDAWVQQPLVWRVHDGIAQAVLLGRVRFTWSVQDPIVRVEQRDALMGWAPATVDAWRTVLTQMSLAQTRHEGLHLRFVRYQEERVPLLDQERSPLIDVVEQIARHAQRHRPRLQGWSRDGAGLASVSWCPWPVMRTMAPSEVGDLLVRARHGLVAFAHALARLDPFWRTVTRSLWRAQVLGAAQSNGDVSPFTPLVNPEGGQALAPHVPGFGASGIAVLDPWSVLEALGQRWNAWKTAAAEHPRADLLLPCAVALRVTPSQHTWRDDLWGALTGAPRGTWKALREAPRATVAALLRQPGGAHALGLITALVPAGHPLPAAMLRQVPMAWWAQAHAQVHALGGVPAASREWALRRVRAFLDAVHKRVWVEQRQPMLAWLDNALVVLSWALQEAKTPFEDPSWTWDTLEQRWMVRRQRGDQWPTPLRSGQHLGVTFSVVGSEPEWRLLGTALRNCLKDQRSLGYQERVQDREGVLVRLQGQGHSAAFLSYNKDDHNWSVLEHRSAFNQAPPDAHMVVVEDLIALLTATVESRGFRPARAREASVRGWTPAQRARRTPLLDRLDPSWGTFDAWPSWRHPLQRTWAWLNDDRWWHRQGRRKFTRLMQAVLVMLLWYALGSTFDSVTTREDLGLLWFWAVIMTGIVTALVLRLGWKRRARAWAAFRFLMQAGR